MENLITLIIVIVYALCNTKTDNTRNKDVKIERYIVEMYVRIK